MCQSTKEEMLVLMICKFFFYLLHFLASLYSLTLFQELVLAAISLYVLAQVLIWWVMGKHLLKKAKYSKIPILRPPLRLSKSGLKDHFWTVLKVVSNQRYTVCRKWRKE